MWDYLNTNADVFDVILGGVAVVLSIIALKGRRLLNFERAEYEGEIAKL